MEWLAEEPRRGEFILWCIVLFITVVGLWFGRKKLFVAIACALLFLLVAAIAIPGFLPAQYRAWRNACINNLHRIRDAKSAWANTEHKLPPDIPPEEILFGYDGTNRFFRHKLICPRGGKYTIGSVGENPACSFTDKGHKLE